MTKKLFLFLLIISVFNGCSPPSLKENGGMRITLEANVGNVLHDFIQPNDSIGFLTFAETKLAYAHQEKSFLDLFFSDLEQADSKGIAASHFIANGLKPSASLSECKLYFDKKLTMGMENIRLNLEKRLFAFGVVAPVFLTGTKTEQLIVEIPGKYDITRLEALLQSTAKLEFWETGENKEIYPVLQALNASLKEQLYPDLTDTTPLQETKVPKGTSLKEQLNYDKRKNEPELERLKKMNPLFAILNPAIQYDVHREPVDFTPGPLVGYAKMTDTSKVNAYLTSVTAKKLFGPFTKLLWSAQPMSDSVFSLIAIKPGPGGKTPLSGNIIADARIVYETGNDRPYISMTMNPTSKWDWKKMTHDNIGKSIAIVVDDHVYSYPTVIGEIPNGNSNVTGNFTPADAEDLVNVLNAGYLPMSIKIVKEEKVLPGNN